MDSVHSDTNLGFSRRTALGLGGAALAALAFSDPLTAAAPQTEQCPPEAPRPQEKLRVATCQFPVSGNIAENARHVREFMRRAAKSGAHLLHTSEACLSGYARADIPSFAGFDWGLLRRETSGLRESAKELDLWLVLGSPAFVAGAAPRADGSRAIARTATVNSTLSRVVLVDMSLSLDGRE